MGAYTRSRTRVASRVDLVAMASLSGSRGAPPRASPRWLAPDVTDVTDGEPAMASTRVDDPPLLKCGSDLRPLQVGGQGRLALSVRQRAQDRVRVCDERHDERRRGRRSHRTLLRGADVQVSRRVAVGEGPFPMRNRHDSRAQPSCKARYYVHCCALFVLHRVPHACAGRGATASSICQLTQHSTHNRIADRGPSTPRSKLQVNRMYFK